MKKVVYLPLDERPCNLAYVCEVSRDNNAFTLVAPELSEMGNKKTPARYEDIKALYIHYSEVCRSTLHTHGIQTILQVF